MTLSTHLPYLISIVTFATMYLAGNKWRYAWLLGLANQGLWFWWQWEVRAWGLMPLCLGMVVIYTRNHLKWTHSPDYADAEKPAP